MSARLYPWRGDNFSIIEIIAIYKKETGETLARGTLYNRIRARNGCIDSALNFKHKNWPVKKLMCPDGKSRTHKGIALFLGISTGTWFSRFATCGDDLTKVWNIGKSVTKSGAIKRGVRSELKYKWIGKWWTLDEIILKHANDTGELLSKNTLRWRIKNRSSVAKALNFKKKKCWKTAKKHICPDGVSRNHREIATHLGIPYYRWQSRFNKQGRDIAGAFNYDGPKKEERKKITKATNIKTKVAVKEEKQVYNSDTKANKEARRVQAALDALPSPTKYEVGLY